MLESSTYLASIRSNADALVDAAVVAGMAAPVPPCPEWAVADLLAHIGRVHRWAAANAGRTQDDGPASRRDFEIPAGEDPVPWVREGIETVLTALDRPAESPAWAFFPPGDVGFWQRRQAHETAMHRVDAQAAAGEILPIDAQLASDGIDELLDLFERQPTGRGPTGDGATLHFHCTDVRGEWLVTMRPDGIDVVREHAKGDVAARGGASDLLCWLQGRGPIEALEVFGDETLLTRWREVATF